MACHECTVNLVSWNITRTSRFKTINENFNAPWDFLLWHQHLFVKTSALNRLYYFRANSFQKQKLPVTDTAGRLILRADLKCSTDFCFKLVAGTYRTETTKHSTSRNSRAKDVLGRNTLWKKKMLIAWRITSQQAGVYIHTAVYAKNAQQKYQSFNKESPHPVFPNKDILRCRRYSKYIHLPCFN